MSVRRGDDASFGRCRSCLYEVRKSASAIDVPIQKYVRANDLGTAVLLEGLSERRKQIRKLIVASSMSIYGEGAYVCPTCGIRHPQLRSASQLLERQWEFTCTKCGSELRPLPTNEDKPLFPTSVYAITKQDQEQFCLVVGRLWHSHRSASLLQCLRHASGALKSLYRYLRDFFLATAARSGAHDFRRR